MKLGYLCVSGSLGWDYYEADKSDVDLRGVYYLSNKDRYLNRIGEQRTFELSPLECTLWSFDKFWGLLKKSNPSCIEWLLSPTVFSDELFLGFQKRARAKCYNPFSLAKHYYSMAKSNYLKYDKSLSPKKVRYVVRAIESAKSVLGNGLPIMDVSTCNCSEHQDFGGMIRELDVLLDTYPKDRRKDTLWFAEYEKILKEGKV